MNKSNVLNNKSVQRQNERETSLNKFNNSEFLNTSGNGTKP